MFEPPKTLLQMAGADLSPPNLSEAGLVLIDCQNEYLDGGLALPGVEAAVEQAGLLLDHARSVGGAIIHVQHQGQRGSFFDLEGHGGKIIHRLAPQEGEAVITKTLPNSFAKTALEQILKDEGVQKLVIVGFMTHMCVSATARVAMDLGFQNTVVASACATRALPGPDGRVINAQEMHNAALAALGDRFAIIVPTAQDLL